MCAISCLTPLEAPSKMPPHATSFVLPTATFPTTRSAETLTCTHAARHRPRWGVSGGRCGVKREVRPGKYGVAAYLRLPPMPPHATSFVLPTATFPTSRSAETLTCTHRTAPPAVGGLGRALWCEKPRCGPGNTKRSMACELCVTTRFLFAVVWAMQPISVVQREIL